MERFDLKSNAAFKGCQLLKDIPEEVASLINEVVCKYGINHTKFDDFSINFYLGVPESFIKYYLYVFPERKKMRLTVGYGVYCKDAHFSFDISKSNSPMESFEEMLRELLQFVLSSSGLNDEKVSERIEKIIRMERFDFEKLPELNYVEHKIPKQVKDFINEMAERYNLKTPYLTSGWVTDSFFGLCNEDTLLFISPSYRKMFLEVSDGAKKEKVDIPFEMVDTRAPFFLFEALLTGLRTLAGFK